MQYETLLWTVVKYLYAGKYFNQRETTAHVIPAGSLHGIGCNEVREICRREVSVRRPINMTSTREKHKITNTLVCLLKAMEGVKTTVELRNENSVHGQILMVSGQMHLTMANVVFRPVKGPEQRFSDFFVQGHQIRFVHIPDHIDIRKAMEKMLLTRQSVFSNISKAKEQRQMVKEKIAQKREIQRQKREERALREAPQSIQTVTSNRSDV